MDARTVEAAKAGDRTARALLLRVLQDQWFRLCLGLLGDADRSRDATQETALRFLRQLPRFRGDSHLRTWSFGIAINVVREMRRANAAVAAVTARVRDDASQGPRGAGGSGFGSAPPPQPDEAAEAAETNRLLHEALAGLPQRQREALVLRFFEGLSVDETAAVMDCAPGTVKATVHQALQALRRRSKQFT